ncbi:hypothetical protein CGZ94_11770 [Enemella evansiae]|uniref:GNAT family N-acetyltransferase n=1 Tax=Enemella evansiae TaxID=2016499 RepID=A0A255GDG8_9ACTN|nr:hypothetical protein [Enemella evansiae]OYO13631.1 hypothetical protein CGZ94_11770 [Enemella evansiae]
MSDVQIVRAPDAPTPGWTTGLKEFVALSDRSHQTRLGSVDYQFRASEWAAMWVAREQTDQLLWLAVTDGRVVAAMQFGLPLQDNLRLADGWLILDPEYAERASELFDALWDQAREELVRRGRGLVWFWHITAIPDADEAQLEPRTGSGAVIADETADWLAGTGFGLEQVEVLARLDVDDSLVGKDFTALAADAEAASEAYQVKGWVGPTPAELIPAMTELRARMSTDVPAGDLAMEEESWDADRIRYADALQELMGRRTLWMVARHRDSGELAAYTQLSVVDEVPELAWQNDTLVAAAHRGHRLGMRIKLANLAQLREQAPGVRRILTGNADENAHMRSINTTLGFRPAVVGGVWQLELGAQ